MFDGAASSYDQDFTHTDLGHWLRQQIWERLIYLFKAGDTLLEIGCGTGEDAVWLAKQGIHVLATDASPAMLKQTQQKAKSAGVAHLISTQILDLNNLPDAPLGKFAGIYSNFGAVNCTDDWAGIAQFLKANIRPQGKVGLGIISPFCLWETIWHGLHFDFATATRRWNGRSQAVLADGSQFKISYPPPRHVRKALSPYFQQTYVSGLGVFLPPSDIFGVIAKRPRIAQVLIATEKRFAQYPPLKYWADHYWIEFEDVPSSE